MQLTLFDIEPRPLPLERAATEQPAVAREPDALPPSAPAQLILFGGWTALAHDFEDALAAADFDAARAIAGEIVATYGADTLPASPALIGALPVAAWDAPGITPALDAWRALRTTLPTEPGRARRVRDGLFARLLARAAPADVAAAAPDLLVDLCNALPAAGDAAAARLLVRDALLAGRADLDGLEDRAAADLLGEDLSSPWLAALGAIRRLWPLPRPAEAERAALVAALDAPVPDEDDDDARAAAFWDALRVAELRGTVPDDVVHAARRRLKRLHPALHAAYMTRTGPFA